jgi:hypothetical protein
MNSGNLAKLGSRIHKVSGQLGLADFQSSKEVIDLYISTLSELNEAMHNRKKWEDTGQ